MKLIFFFAVFVVTGSLSRAALPEYKAPEILLRADGVKNYNLPPLTFITNSTPALNNQGDVAIKLMAIEGEAIQGIWAKSTQESAGRIVVRGPAEKVLSDPSLNDQGKMVFSIFEEGASDGIFTFDLLTGQQQQVLSNQGTDLINHSYPQILNNGDVVFRGTHASDDHSYFKFSRALAPLLTEGQIFNDFQASYLFGPSVNNQQQWAFKIRVGERKQWGSEYPDQIVLLQPDGSSRLVAVDTKTDPASAYEAFTNFVGLSEQGDVVFVAYLKSGKKSIVVDRQGVKTVFATEDHGPISEIELFGPRINSKGMVAFRAKDSAGKRALFVADGLNIKRVIGEGDEILTDLGPGRIISQPDFPAFGGGIALNDKNELCFSTVIVSLDGSQVLGSAVYKQNPMY